MPPAITVTIIESELKIIAGIPASVILNTNIPSTIFYTLDGTDPTLSSDIAIGAIELPRDQNTVTLKIFATDGVSSTPIITQTFSPNTSTLRQPRDKVTGIDFITGKSFPFSSPGHSPAVNGIYGNTAGITVNDPLKPQIPDGYDGTNTNTHSNFTNEELTDYTFRFSTTNSIGEKGKGIGTLPAAVTVIKKSNEKTISSNTSDRLFESKALVIFQDLREPQSDIPIINRPHYKIQNPQDRDGGLMNTSETQPTTGSVLRQHYNPVDNTMTFYYYDNRTSRWIISTTPYKPKNPNLGNYSNIILPANKQGAGFVFKWHRGIRRRLY